MSNVRPPEPFSCRAWAAACASAVLLLSVGCAERRTLEQQAELFARWFVAPDAARTDSLTKAVPTVERLSEAAEMACRRAAARPGEGASELTSRVGGAWTLGFRTPQSFRHGEKYPLVIYLHGGIGGAAPDKGSRAWEMVGPLVDSCEAIVASPTATAQAPWWSAAGLGRILQTVRFMSLHFPVDYERVVLVGVSDGAVGCYAASCAIPGPFAGFVAVSGYGGMLPSLGVAVIPGNMMQRPFYNIHAGQDRLFPLAQVNTFLDQLAAEGMRVERKEYPQEQHGFDYRAQEMGALAERVRQWRRPSGRTGLSWRIQQDLPWRADNLVSAGVAKGTAGIPAVNASWDRGRLTVSSIGVRSIVFLAERQEQPPVVVVNGRAEERCRDLSRDPASVLSAIQHRCVPQVPESAIYGATFSGE